MRLNVAPHPTHIIDIQTQIEPGRVAVFLGLHLPGADPRDCFIRLSGWGSATASLHGPQTPAAILAALLASGHSQLSPLANLDAAPSSGASLFVGSSPRPLSIRRPTFSDPMYGFCEHGRWLDAIRDSTTLLCPVNGTFEESQALFAAQNLEATTTRIYTLYIYGGYPPTMV